MPTNIEIKAILRDRSGAEAIARRLTHGKPEIIHQDDYFFPCEDARLKLRVLGPSHGELIRYRRANSAQVRSSHYEIARTSDPGVLLDILTRALGTAGSVRKTRSLYLIGQTRVHLDQVEGLGDFFELEVVLRPDQEEVEGERIAANLLAEFGIRREDLLADAYVDLLARRAAP